MHNGPRSPEMRFKKKVDKKCQIIKSTFNVTEKSSSSSEIISFNVCLSDFITAGGLRYNAQED